MKMTILVVTIFFTSILSFNTYAIDKVIYGSDDRIEVYEGPSLFQNIANSVAGKVSKDLLVQSGSIFKMTGTSKLGSRYCPSIKFADQYTLPSCTGSLIAKNLILTAGHCMRETIDCDGSYWVFNFALKHTGDNSYGDIDKDRVYTCKKIVAHKQSLFDGIDYAIVELNRDVTGREALSMEFEVDQVQNQAVTMLGHPSGLPMKYVDKSIITSLPRPYSFESDLDGFHGNSGSPIFDASSGKIIGLMSMGQGDYTWDSSGKCKIPKICKSGDKCNLSLISKIINVKEDFLKVTNQ